MNEATLKNLIAPIIGVFVLATAVPLVLDQFFVAPEQTKGNTLEGDLNAKRLEDRIHREKKAAYDADVAQRNKLWDKLDQAAPLYLPPDEKAARKQLELLTEELYSTMRELEPKNIRYEIECTVGDLREFEDGSFLTYTIEMDNAPTDAATEIISMEESQVRGQGNYTVWQRTLAKPLSMRVEAAGPEGQGLHVWQVRYAFPLERVLDRATPQPPKAPPAAKNKKPAT